MLNRIKIATSIVVILAILLFLQMLSGGLSFRAQSSSDDAFATIVRLNERADTLEAAWTALLEARISLNRGAQRLMLADYSADTDQKDQYRQQASPLFNAAEQELKKAQQLWQEYSSTPPNPKVNSAVLNAIGRDYETYVYELTELLRILRANDVNGFIAHPTQGYQNALRDSYSAYLSDISNISDALSAEMEEASNTAFWAILSVMLATLTIFLISLLGMKKILIAPMNNLLENIKSIASGDLVTKITVQGTNEMGQFAAGLREMQSALAKTVGEVRASADAIFNGASEIANGNNDLSARTEQQAASLEQTAASMEQLTATVKQNAENAQQASGLASGASETAELGGKAVEDVVHVMNEIANSSQKISEITGVIDGIAFQTNILALNAAVEAARAGEQGRGFAVVASEVRSLAQRSALAAKEITTLINESVNKITSGSRYAENAGKTMGDVITAVSNVTHIMNEIASASEEQSRGIQQVGIAVSEMDRVTQQNTTLVEESATASAELEAQASRLNQSVAVFVTH